MFGISTINSGIFGMNCSEIIKYYNHLITISFYHHIV